MNYNDLIGIGKTHVITPSYVNIMPIGFNKIILTNIIDVLFFSNKY